jgi:dTDP-4-amino-4,6-dideoxygalactose transaminase
MECSPSQFVRTFDLQRSLEGIELEVAEAVQRVMRSGHVLLGPELRSLEKEFADYTGAAAAVGVASGTDALILALKATGVGIGDEVITVANTAVPTAAAIRAAGAIPRFVDVDPSSLLIDVAQAEAAVNSRTRAIIPVHLYGLPVPMQPLLDLARKAGLRIIEDCAHAHGAREAGVHVGTQGDVGCFSFYPTKNMGALGDAGICITQDPEIAARLRQLRMYGFDGDRVAICDGLNSRLDEIQAAVLRIRLQRLEECQSQRNVIAAYYRAALQDSAVVLPPLSEDRTHAWHQFVIRVADRPAFMRILEAQGVGCGIHYEYPLHRMPAFAPWFPAGNSLPVTELAAAQVLSIPMAPWLRTEECLQVTSALRCATRGPAA